MYPTLNYGQLKALWEKHATGPAAAPGVSTVAAAIALAESGGKPVVNSIGATSYWQIHPGGSQYLAPDANAQAAVAKFNGAAAAGRDGFTPWTTYTGADTPGHEKTYKKYLPGGDESLWDKVGKAAIGSLPGGAAAQAAAGAVGVTAGDVVDTATAVPKFLSQLGQSIFNPQWWLRVGLIVGGILAMVAGVVFFGRQFATSQVSGIVAGALPQKG